MHTIKDLFSIPMLIAICMIVSIYLINRFMIPPYAFILIITGFTIQIGIVCLTLDNKFHLILIIIVFIMLVLLSLRIENIQKGYRSFKYDLYNHNKIIGQIDSFPTHKKGNIRVTLKVLAIQYSHTTDFHKTIPFKILVTVKDTTDFPFQRGDTIMINRSCYLPMTSIKGFKYRQYLYNKQIFGIIRIKPEHIKNINTTIAPPFIDVISNKTIRKLRLQILHTLDKHIKFSVKNFLASIFFGLRDHMDDDTIVAFRNSGMVHLLAISGLHIGFIGLIVYTITKKFFSRSRSLIVSVIFAFLFINIISPSASSIRAFVMYTLTALFFITGTHTTGITGLAYSAVLLLFVNPGYIYDLGFRFSYLATTSILLLSNYVTKMLPYIIPEKVRSGIGVTVSAFIGIFLLQWSLFNQVPIFSLISSLIIVPLFSFLFAVLLAAIILLTITKFAIIACIIELITSGFLMVIHWLAKIPPLSLPPISPWLSYIIIPSLVIIAEFIIYAFRIIRPLTYHYRTNIKLKYKFFLTNFKKNNTNGRNN